MSKTLAKLVFLLAFFSVPALGKGVFVKLSNGQTGHGQLRSFNQKCYVVLPKHIVEDPAQIHLVGAKGRESDATVFYEDPELDLAILKAASTDLCLGAPGTYSTTALDDVLSSTADAQLRVATEDGSEVRIDLKLAETNNRTIRFRSSQPGELVEGLSGSEVGYKNKILGLMTRYDSSTHVATAYREDLVEQFWKGHMFTAPRCEAGCEVAVSALTKVGTPCQQNTNPISNQVETVCDLVYELPDSWPTPTYFHVVLNRSVLDNPGLSLHVDSGWQVFNFALSTSSAFKAQDYLISAVAFETLKRTEQSFQLGNKLWSIEISGGTDPASMNIRITPVRGLF